MRKGYLLIAILFIVAMSCTDDDSSDLLNISDFSIIKNTKEGVFLKTKINRGKDNNSIISNHGVILTRNNELLDKINLGQLDEDEFSYVLSSGVSKGLVYSVLPFIDYDENIIYGDSLSFISNVDVDIVIDDIIPCQGFVSDTISIIGRNFCKPDEFARNEVLLNGLAQYTIYESDELIKFVIRYSIDTPVQNIVLRSCNIETIVSPSLEISAPVIDSVSSGKSYYGGFFYLYAKNFKHSSTRVWLGDKEVEIDKYNEDEGAIKVEVPLNLPTGMLDIRLEVLGKSVVAKGIYESTTSYLEDRESYEISFLDTITVKGKYFIQPLVLVESYSGNMVEIDWYSGAEVLVGGVEQEIISRSETEMKVLINRYFYGENPKLKIRVGSHWMEEDVEVLTPEITSLDKDIYHIVGNKIKITTENFMGSYIKVGGILLSYSRKEYSIDGEGTIIINNDILFGLDISRKYMFEGVGKLKVEIYNAHGSSSVNFNVFPPVIEPLDNINYFKGEMIRIKGTDFGYEGVSEIYLDDVLLEETIPLGYSIRNDLFKFILPEDISIGKHRIKIITGGQSSDEIEINIKEITVDRVSLDPVEGTRNNVYSITGNNLDNKAYFDIVSEGLEDSICYIISNTTDKVEFRFVGEIPLLENNNLVLKYGDIRIELGNIKGKEPYSYMDNYNVYSGYNTNNFTFEYNEELHSVGGSYIRKYNLANNKWEILGDEAIPMGYSYPSYYNISFVTVSEDKLYFTNSRKCYVYDLKNKTWLDPVVFEGVVKSKSLIYEGELFYFREVNPNDFKLFKYNLKTSEIVKLSDIGINKIDYVEQSNFYCKDGLIFFKNHYDDIYKYDISRDTWENIGYPRLIHIFNSNFHLYRGVLYMSGGSRESSPVSKMYSYDLATKEWKERTNMLKYLKGHSVVGSGGSLYIGLGKIPFRFSYNYDMQKYDIDLDNSLE